MIEQGGHDEGATGHRDTCRAYPHPLCLPNIPSALWSNDLAYQADIHDYAQTPDASAHGGVALAPVPRPGERRPPPSARRPAAKYPDTAAEAVRSGTLGDSVSHSPRLASPSDHRSARHGRPLAPEGLATLLAMAERSRQRQAKGVRGGPCPDPPDVTGEPALGCSAHPR